MKKWSEIKQATLNKLFLEEEEARQQGYLEKFQDFANEGLDIIANGVKPKIAVFEAIGVDEVIEVDELELRGSVLYYFLNGEEHIADPNADNAYSTGTITYVFKNKKWTPFEYVVVKNGVLEMPDDFLSFADMIGYLDGEPDPEVIFVTDKQIILPKKGSYKILYNAMWHEIDKIDITEDLDLKIDASVLRTLPTYMASQILAQDDIQRSAILKNEFEVMLARLDTNVMYESNHYRSTGGWY